MAFPVAQMTKLSATTTLFLVWPPMLRDTIDSARVWADQNDSVM